MVASTGCYIQNMQLVLASQSPRRREILSNAGIPFVVRASGVAEHRLQGELAEHYVIRLAREKALAVDRDDDEIILSADTVVVIDNEILEKPRDGSDAARMLRLLSGREHQVLTAICLRAQSDTLVDSARTRVRFVGLTGREINDYIESGEPMDKAGAYAIQGLASKFIDRIEGCYFNVVGLPISLVYGRLKEIGFDV
jgi:septum formation protein